MLVLSRRKDEKIVLTLENGDLIEVSILKIEGSRVKLGIDAPESVHISRPRIQENNNGSS